MPSTRSSPLAAAAALGLVTLLACSSDPAGGGQGGTTGTVTNGGAAGTTAGASGSAAGTTPGGRSGAGGSAGSQSGGSAGAVSVGGSAGNGPQAGGGGSGQPGGSGPQGGSTQAGGSAQAGSGGQFVGGQGGQPAGGQGGAGAGGAGSGGVSEGPGGAAQGGEAGMSGGSGQGGASACGETFAPCCAGSTCQGSQACQNGTCHPVGYPSGPYGLNIGDVITNLSFQGLVDPKASGYSASPGTFQKIAFSDYYNPTGDPSKAVALVVTGDARWCAPCKDEASKNAANWKYWNPRGVQFMSAVIQDENYGPSTYNDVSIWSKTYTFEFPTLLDPSPPQLGAYFGADTVPFNMVIDLRTMKILYKIAGEITFDQNNATLKKATSGQ